MDVRNAAAPGRGRGTATSPGRRSCGGQRLRWNGIDPAPQSSLAAIWRDFRDSRGQGRDVRPDHVGSAPATSSAKPGGNGPGPRSTQPPGQSGGRRPTRRDRSNRPKPVCGTGRFQGRPRRCRDTGERRHSVTEPRTERGRSGPPTALGDRKSRQQQGENDAVQVQDPSRPRGVAHPVRSIAGWFTGAWEGAGPGSRHPSRSVRRSGTRPV